MSESWRSLLEYSVFTLSNVAFLASSAERSVFIELITESITFVISPRSFFLVISISSSTFSSGMLSALYLLAIPARFSLKSNNFSLSASTTRFFTTSAMVTRSSSPLSLRLVSVSFSLALLAAISANVRSYSALKSPSLATVESISSLRAETSPVSFSLFSFSSASSNSLSKASTRWPKVPEAPFVLVFLVSDIHLTYSWVTAFVSLAESSALLSSTLSFMMLVSSFSLTLILSCKTSIAFSTWLGFLYFLSSPKFKTTLSNI